MIPYFAVIVAREFVATVSDLMTKETFDCPAENDNVAGTGAALLEETRLTFNPPVGAGPFKVTEAVALAPPETLPGTTSIATIGIGLTVSVAV